MQGLRLATAALLTLSITTVRAEVLLVHNVNVLPLDSPRIIEQQAVLVRDGIIAAIAPLDLLAVPEEAEVIDADGAYLMPGLSDMHAHIVGYVDNFAESAGELSVAENQLLLYLATGVTLLRDTGGSEQHFAIQQQVAANEWLGPELHFTSPVLEGANNVWGFSTQILDAEAAEVKVSEIAERGYWGIKIYHTLSAPVFEAVMVAARNHSLPVVGHVPFEVGIERALRSGMLSIEHLRGYDFDGMIAEDLFKDGGRSQDRFRSLVEMSDERMNDLVALTVAEGVWNCPTLAIAQFLFDQSAREGLTRHPRYEVVHPQLRNSVEHASALDAIFPPEAKEAMREAFPRSLELVGRLHAAGAGLLIGTDAVIPAWVPGFTPIDEMQLIASSGVPNYDVLRMATIDAARALNLDSERGTVAVGKRASLILIDGNPLEDLAALWRLRGVVHGGRWLPLSELEVLLRKQAERFPAKGSL